MQKDHASVVCGLARVVLEGAVQRGASRPKLLFALGSESVRLEQPSGRVSRSALRRLLEAIEVSIDDPGFAVDAGAGTRSDDCGLPGFVLLTSETGLELGDTVECQRLVSSCGGFRLASDREGIHVYYDEDLVDPCGDHVWTEAALSSVIATLRDAFEGVTLLRVCFRHPAPRSTVRHRDFFGVPLHFAAQQNSVLLPWSFAELSPRCANRAMHRHFLAHARIELAAMGRKDSLPQRTRAQIAVALARTGSASLRDVARALGFGERTLRRKLAEESVNFRALVEELRMREAERLLSDRERSVSEVAELLGFSEPSAFSRAFRRAFGTGPTEHRRRAR